MLELRRGLFALDSRIDREDSIAPGSSAETVLHYWRILGCFCYASMLNIYALIYLRYPICEQL